MTTEEFTTFLLLLLIQVLTFYIKVLREVFCSYIFESLPFRLFTYDQCYFCMTTEEFTTFLLLLLIQVLTFYIKVLREVFALIFLKAYPLGCLRMISVTSV